MPELGDAIREQTRTIQDNQSKVQENQKMLIDLQTKLLKKLPPTK